METADDGTREDSGNEVTVCDKMILCDNLFHRNDHFTLNMD